MSSTTLVAQMGASQRLGVHSAEYVYSHAKPLKWASHSNENTPPNKEPPAKRRKYKTTMSEVRVKKNPLDLRPDTNVPLDYNLVKYGRKDVTSFLLNLSRKFNLPVWIANSSIQSQRSEAQAHDTSRSGYHVGRVGYYFQKDLIGKACKWFQIRVQRGDIKSDRNSHQSNVTKNDLKTCLEEIYPHIPDRDRNTIIGRLNPKNGSSIGKASNLNPYKQVELAVISHIRHAHTDYDKLLRYGNKSEARKSIQAELLAKLAEWKGEDTKEEWETEFHEVIDVEQDPEEVLEEDDEHYSPPLPQGWFEPRRSTETPGIPSRPSTRHPEVEQLNPRHGPTGVPVRFGAEELQGYTFQYQPFSPQNKLIDLTQSSPVRPGGHGNAPGQVRARQQPPPAFDARQSQQRITLRRLPAAESSRTLPPPPEQPRHPQHHQVHGTSWNPYDHVQQRMAPPLPSGRNEAGSPPSAVLTYDARLEPAFMAPTQPAVQWRPLPPPKQPAIRYRPLQPIHGKLPAIPSDMRYRPVTPDIILPSKEPHSPPSNSHLRPRPADWDDYYSPQFDL